ncbi:hypothetical protein GIB67_030313 [Kingdonia uniflora]|uniref:Amino acid transporter transmembrane domain-containing protein n=1 Tax=Kingdonia uniflora TaxID=39325 RepID=A0A7J7M6P0_9MAGN|nr:hypothetical protein GIB67_030313 [Kingdonia uniflora]
MSPIQSTDMGNDRTKAKEIARQKRIDDWLPATSSRGGNWAYAVFHNVTAMVGAGVLSLPYAMSELGWYHELGQYAFGDRLGLWIVVPQQLVVEIGTNIVYMVTGGKSLKKAYDTWCHTSNPHCKDIKLTYWIMIFAAPNLALAQFPSFNSIWGVSFAAADMSLSYSTIAWAASTHKGIQPDISYAYKASTRTGAFFNFCSSLGDVAFSYAGYSVVLEIQATVASSPEKPSKKAMWRGCVVAYIIVALCYFPVAIIGYWMFGNSIDNNILISLQKP